jgi:CDP-diglyceride synthetase
MAFLLAHMFQASVAPLVPATLAIVAAFGAVTILVFIAEGMRGRRTPNVLGALFTLAGALYLGFAFGFLIDLWIANGDATRGWLGTLPVWLLLALTPTWAADITAYLVGSRVGRRKIAPRISPGKTWEGTLAGFGAAAIVALLVAASAGIKTGPTLLVAALVGPVGLASDLLESAIKRAAGAKDSGTLLPGHGGVLDRIDSLILVAPFVALALALASGMG